MSINDIIEDLKSEIEKTKKLLSETEDEETKTVLDDMIWNLNQELNNIFKTINNAN